MGFASVLFVWFSLFYSVPFFEILDLATLPKIASPFLVSVYRGRRVRIFCVLSLCDIFFYYYFCFTL